MRRDQALPVGQAALRTPVPATMAAFLPFSTLNPAQAQIVPEVLGRDQNLLVVAPTGSGKTVIGMAFEAICRIAALRETLAGAGALVVDEVHMLGDPGRGPVLEALLARIRDSERGTRIVGLSATVSNAEQVTDWLRAKLLRASWRPSRLTWQLPLIPAHADFAVAEAARTRLAASIAGLVTRDGGSVIVFCGSKRNVRRTALVIAGNRGVNVSGVRQDDTQRLQRRR